MGLRVVLDNTKQGQMNAQFRINESANDMFFRVPKTLDCGAQDNTVNYFDEVSNEYISILKRGI